MARTPMQQLFFKQIQRLKAIIRREYRKTGVELDADLIPKMPKRVTKKALQDIKDIKPFDLRKESQYYDAETGEIITYKEAVERARQERQVEKPEQINTWRGIIDDYYNSIEKWNPDFQAKMHAWIEGLVSQYGEDAVGIMLYTGISEGLIVTKEIVYEEDKTQAYMAEMLRYLHMPSDIMAEILSDVETGIGYNEPE